MRLVGLRSSERRLSQLLHCWTAVLDCHHNATLPTGLPSLVRLKFAVASWAAHGCAVAVVFRVYEPPVIRRTHRREPLSQGECSSVDHAVRTFQLPGRPLLELSRIEPEIVERLEEAAPR